MSTEMSHPFQVVFDEEKNKYYRMNKITGEIQPSYKTGKLPAKFDPQVTGTDYNARKKLINGDKFVLGYSSGKRSNQSYYKPHTESIKKSFWMTKQGFSFTRPDNSPDSSVGGQEQLRRKVQEMKGQTKGMKQRFRKTSNQNFNKNERSDTLKLFPVLNKPTSVAFIAPLSLQKKMPNSSIYQTIQKFSQNVQQKVMDSNQPASPLTSPKTNMSISFAQEDLIQNPNLNRLENKLIRFCQIESLKTFENNYQPFSKDQKSQRFQKFAQKSLKTSILDDSGLSSSPTHHKGSLLLNAEIKERKTVSRNDVAKSLDTLQKENRSLLLLANKCKKKPEFSMQKTPKNSLRPPQLQNQLMNLKELEQRQKLKSLIGKEKEMFLSFYPKYVFKQNPRLIQQQKDRKINLKKLEQTFLENGERKFGKIYHSRTQQAKETQ